MRYYFEAAKLIANGGRYGRSGLAETVLLVVLRQCRLHWLRA